MVGHTSKNDSAAAGADRPAARATWVTPRVIVSDLADARANTIIPGGDGSISSYGPYGS
ncbi:MAG TPA: hypothetical protein VI407_02585 [Erythrobacter sp.]